MRREALRRRHVLLVDPNDDRRRVLATSLRLTGRSVFEASTPLEAIRNLGHAPKPQIVAIAETSPRSIGEELRAYVIKEHVGLDVARASEECCL